MQSNILENVVEYDLRDRGEHPVDQRGVRGRGQVGVDGPPLQGDLALVNEAV